MTRETAQGGARTRAVSFDIWGTLVRSDPRFKPARNEVLRSVLAPGVAADEFDAVLRQADRDADDLCIADGQDRALAERLDLALARLEEAGHTTGRATLRPSLDPLISEQARLARAYHPLPLDDRLPTLLAELAATRPVALTSNTGMLPGELMRPLLDATGLLEPTQVHVFSNEVGWCKPRPEIFEATFTQLREQLRHTPEAGAGEELSPAQVLHVGDNPVADVEGAAAYGMSTALVVTGEDTAAVIEGLLR